MLQTNTDFHTVPLMKTAYPPILEMKNVTVVRGDENRKVLNGVSLKVLAGENIAILGPNGAGKTSLMKLITRDYYPLAKDGTVFRVWGRDRWHLFELRDRLGLVSNDLQAVCAREISGMEAVLSGFFGGIGLHRERVTREQKEKALKVLEFLEIAHLKNRKMSVMSSGEARRFLIARALVHDPRALILDEPTNSLDLRSTRHFRSMVRKIARSGVNIVLITQTLQDIIPEITRVVLMKNGRLLEDGPKEKILTARHIGALFDMRVRISRHDGYYYAPG